MNELIDECKSEKSLVNFPGALLPWGIVWYWVELPQNCCAGGASGFQNLVLN